MSGLLFSGSWQLDLTFSQWSLWRTLKWACGNVQLEHIQVKLSYLGASVGSLIFTQNLLHWVDLVCWMVFQSFGMWHSVVEQTSVDVSGELTYWLAAPLASPDTEDGGQCVSPRHQLPSTVVGNVHSDTRWSIACGTYPILLRLAQFFLHILQFTATHKRNQVVSEFLFHSL